MSLDFGQVLDQNQGLVSHLQVSLAKPWPRLKFGLTEWFVSFGSFLKDQKKKTRDMYSTGQHTIYYSTAGGFMVR